MDFACAADVLLDSVAGLLPIQCRHASFQEMKKKRSGREPRERIQPSYHSSCFFNIIMYRIYCFTDVK